ncbi:MAG: dTMP kinase [Minwuia sp.]|nr:dTMP kinase [Minwuia sp.]
MAETARDGSTPRGFFITFEGGEGVGKSTQTNLLAGALRDLGHTVTTTREPGGTPAAETLRGLLLDPAQDLDPVEQVLLLNAARHSHMRQVITPATGRGEIVICDRFIDSTRAYQGAAGGLDDAAQPDLIMDLHRMVMQGRMPDLTIMLDAPVGTGLDRAAARAAATDRFETAQRVFHENLRQGFLDIAAREPDRCHVVAATGPAEAIAAQILGIVLQRLARP